jgi:hypothetical protein
MNGAEDSSATRLGTEATEGAGRVPSACQHADPRGSIPICRNMNSARRARIDAGGAHR